MSSVVQIKTYGTNVTVTPAVNSFTSAPVLGNGVLVGCSLSNNFTPGNITGVTDSGGNAYSKLFSQIDGNGGNNCSSELWWCSSITAATGTISAAFNAGQSVQICLMEINGWALAADQTGGTGTASNPLTVTATGANTNAADLEVCICSVSFGASAISNPATTSNGTFNVWALGTGNAGGSPNQASYRIATGVDTANATWNWTTSESGAGLIVTFNPVVLSNPGPGPLPRYISVMP